MDLSLIVPKLDPISPTNVALSCLPAVGGPDVKSNKAVNMQVSLFIKNANEEDSETLILLAIEEVAVKLGLGLVNFLEFSVGSAFGAIRINSENPVCQPSGIFASVNLEPDFGLGKGLRDFLNLPTPTRQADIGFTWLDNPTEVADAIQSIFLRVKIQDLAIMGFSIPEVTIEIQYFDDLEFDRRRRWTEEACCTLPNVDALKPCSVAASPITNFIRDTSNRAQPTLALFFEANKPIEFIGGIIKFDEVLVQFFLQVPENNGDVVRVQLEMAVKVEVLYIAGLAVKASFESITDPDTGATNINASFFAQAEVNIGVGIAIAKVWAEAEVTSFTYDASDDDEAGGRRHLEAPAHRALQTRGNGDISQADFSLNVELNFEVAEWVKDLGEAIYKGLVAVYEGLKVAWNAIVDFVEDLWEGVKAIASAIGGAISAAVEAVAGAINDGIDTLSNGLTAITSVLDGVPVVGDIADVLNDIGQFALATVKTAVNLGAAIFTGDWSAVKDILGDIGTAIAGAFGFGKKTKNKKLNYLYESTDPVLVKKTDSILNCPLQYYTWTECRRVFGINVSCKSKRSKDFPEEACTRMRSEQLHKLEMDTKKAEENDQCRVSSEARNQGVKFVGESSEADLPDLSPRMENIETDLGRISSIAQQGGVTCEKQPVNVTVNTLASDSPGLSGSTGTKGIMSSECVDFSNEGTLKISLENLRDDAAKQATDIARGSQGIDKDSEVDQCRNVSGLTCRYDTS